MHVATTDVQSNPNIGLYAFATDKVCVIGPEAEPIKELIEEVLKVPVVITTIAGTSLAGVFLCGEGEHILIPDLVFEHEEEKLLKAGLKVTRFDTTHTALGNNIAIGNQGVIAGPMFSQKEIKELQEKLDKPIKQFSIAQIEVTGSSIVTNQKGALIHRDASDNETQMIKDTLGVEIIARGSVNLGVPYVKAGIIANSNGFLIGSSSGGPEITNADEALGFLTDA